MPFIKSSFDGTQIHYVEYVPASSPSPFKPSGLKANKVFPNKMTLVFLHGWPMSSLIFEPIMLQLCENHRIRCVAIDRRGFGQSEWSSGEKGEDITYEVFAEDTLAVIESLKLDVFVFVGYSMGCGESVLTYNVMTKDLKARCKGFLWMGASLPFPIQTPSNPTAPSWEVWDSILAGFRDDRAGFVHSSLPGLFGISEEINVSKGVLTRYEYIIQQANALAIERCSVMVSAYDFTEKLRKLGQNDRVEVMLLHGDRDHSAPFEATARIVGELMPKAEVKVYEKGAHGILVTHKSQVVDDILNLVEKCTQKV